MERLDSLTEVAPADDSRRAALVWGYAERLRHGMESPFRLVESAARDPRLTPDEQRTVSWALLAHVLGGQTHHVDPAALDGIGPRRGRESAAGEQHLQLITRAVGATDDARAGELGVRIAYSLAGAERLIEGSALSVVSAVAALVADREIARREALSVIRAAGDPVEEIRVRRAERSFYVERPTMFATSEKLERAAVEIGGWVLDSLRAMVPLSRHAAPGVDPRASDDARLAPGLYAAGAAMPPAAPMVVTIRRHLPLIRAHGGTTDLDALKGAHNGEMLAAVLATTPQGRSERRGAARLRVAVAAAMRATAQELVWFPGDSAPSAAQLVAGAGISDVTFDRDVPPAWRGYFMRQLANAVGDLRLVLPALALDPVRVRFRMTAPADSALAMHDPRTRTLHLPVLTSAGTLTHELAHDLDRHVAVQQGHQGYRSDYVTRNSARDRGRGVNTSVAASLRALTEESTNASSRPSERPAEVFATQVDWFVARALASRGISNGFLTAVQDELLTGHVVHPERLRSGSRSRPLLHALRGMTTVAPFAAEEYKPSAHALVRWALAGPLEPDAAVAILEGSVRAWNPPRLDGSGTACASSGDARVELLRLAAESRARGWLRLRARSGGDRELAPWEHAARTHAPWAAHALDVRVAMLRDHILMELAAPGALPAGSGAHAAALAARARCLH